MQRYSWDSHRWRDSLDVALDRVANALIVGIEDDVLVVGEARYVFVVCRDAVLALGRGRPRSGGFCHEGVAHHDVGEEHEEPTPLDAAAVRPVAVAVAGVAVGLAP